MRLFALLDQDTYEADIVAYTDDLETAAYMFALTDGEPAINAGVTPTATVDRDGNAIPKISTNPDIGAYEYGY